MTAATSPEDVLITDLEVSAQVDAALHEGAVIVAETGEILWCNDTACRIIGVRRTDVIGAGSFGDGWEAIRLDGTAVPRHEHPGLRALATGEPVADSVMGIRIGDDNELWLRIGSKPTIISGHPVAVTVFSDVTNEVNQRRDFEATMGQIKRTLVQPAMPISGRVYFTARHRSAGPTRLIGGDFYGAHRLDENRFGFFIGDVCGHGVQAAGLSALARHTMNVAGALLNDPSEVLGHLHDVVAAERPDTYLTAVYGYVDIGELITVRFAAGGHPPPLLIGQGGVRTLDDVGPIVGMVPNQVRPITVLEVEPGDQLLLYTDGLTSTHERQVEASEVLQTLPPQLLTDVLADLVLSLADQGEQPEHADDATVLALGFH